MSVSRLLQFDRYELDLYRRVLTADGERVALPTQLLSALIYLVRHRDRDVTRRDLRRALYRREDVDSDAALDRCVLALRRLLGDTGRRPRLIQITARLGYRFIGQVAGDRVSPAASSSPPRLRLLAEVPPASAPAPAASRPSRRRPTRPRAERPHLVPAFARPRRLSSAFPVR